MTDDRTSAPPAPTASPRTASPAGRLQRRLAGLAGLLAGAVATAAFWAGTTDVTVRADGPGDNLPDAVRRIPPVPKAPLPPADKEELTAGAKALGDAIAKLEKELAGKPALARYLPDVIIYHKAVDWAVRFNEVYDVAKEVPVARALLKTGHERAALLAEGKHPWTTQTGLIARGYRSKLDGSVQPYGIFVPDSFAARPADRKYRLDFWCHGRGETLTELAFINGVQKSGTEFKPADHFLIQLYGRYCCANKMAGEIDCWEALDHARHDYPVDDDRLVMRGFSMGGAAAWQFATHYTDRFCAAAPGAGFSETPDFLKVFQRETLKPTWYEQTLWRWYDCTDYALNLYNLPTVAYSGELDSQKQAADVMIAALKKEGLEIPHVIGPKTKHSYHKDSKPVINKFVDEAAAKGRNRWPHSVKLVTYTLRYNKMHWVSIRGMERHWERATVEADLKDGTITVKTSNVTELEIDLPKDPAAAKFPKTPKIVVDGQELPLQRSKDDGSTWLLCNRKLGGKWTTESFVLADLPNWKRPGLQGPIDDAFMDRFVVVKPTGKPLNDTVGKFVERELAHAVEHWRRTFRGELTVLASDEVTDKMIEESNLILFGDPSSNPLIAKLAAKLPITWTAEGVKVGDRTFTADKHVPVFVAPSPASPSRYVVINSGFTFREYDYLNNARQVAKLPDWAVIDASTPMTSRGPGVVVDADFFDEMWKVRPARPAAK